MPLESPARAGASTKVLAPVMEVFASFQGEGLYVGEPQVFVRLRGCPLRCRWCDTPGSWRLGDADEARVDAQAGRRREASWASPFQVACWIGSVEPGGPRTVSLTGGEPLMWPDFARELRGFLGERRLHLETSGGYPRALARVIDAVDHVSLDLKLPSDLDPPVALPAGAGPERASSDEPSPTDGASWRLARRRTLELVSDRDACGKLVVTGDTEPEACRELFSDVADLAPDLPVVLQPVTPVGAVPPARREQLDELCRVARDEAVRARVIPQVHRQLGLP